jgi:glycosyltransferase involved in cell wall biosynthesis
LALLEAWSAGLPVIASAVGGIPDLITHGTNGLLFPSGDEDALVAGLAALLAAPDRAQCMAEIARQEVRERYSLHRMADEYNHHYQSLLNSTSG